MRHRLKHRSKNPKSQPSSLRDVDRPLTIDLCPFVNRLQRVSAVRQLSRMHFSRSVLVILLCYIALIAFSSAAEAQDVPPCASDTAFGWLDFWVGTWDVYVGDKMAGTNRIEKMLDGCAITEHWTSSTGNAGFSLFYFLPDTRTWKQVWVTGHALGPGGVKEKELVVRFPDGGVRFQGQVPSSRGGYYLDRTTLTPVNANEVRQLIEVSTDGGEEWRTVFDGRYVRQE